MASRAPTIPVEALLTESAGSAAPRRDPDSRLSPSGLWAKLASSILNCSLTTLASLLRFASSTRCSSAERKLDSGREAMKLSSKSLNRLPGCWSCFSFRDSATLPCSSESSSCPLANASRPLTSCSRSFVSCSRPSASCSRSCVSCSRPSVSCSRSCASCSRPSANCSDSWVSFWRLSASHSRSWLTCSRPSSIRSRSCVSRRRPSVSRALSCSTSSCMLAACS
mmetsp:Transcript_56826/g.166329  ORF Transcript_56826/g.166329 Transcript_56826/m.166329 type:complete len:224 (+) Transcript_56826:967-1638(+)